MKTTIFNGARRLVTAMHTKNKDVGHVSFRYPYSIRIVRLSIFMLCFLTIGVGNVWADTWELTYTDFNTTSYAANDGSHTKNNIEYTTKNVMRSGSKIQIKKKDSPYICNTTAMPGDITSITLTDGSNVVIKVGSSSSPSSGTTVTSGESVSSGNRYFYITSNGSTATVTTITVTYSAASCTSITPSLSYTSTSLVVGGTSSSPTVSGNSGSGAVTYSSSDTDVATVNSSTGVVTAVAAGSATITASIASATSDGTTYCSGSATASFTISIPRYTVSFSTGSGNPSQTNIQEESAGDGIELPDGPTPACSSDGWEFAGWATSSCSESTTAPILYLPGDTYYPESDETLYAVYRKLTSGTSTASFTASDISNLTEHPVYNLDWLHTASGAELYIEDGQRYTGSPAAWNVTKGTSHYAILDAHRKISGISITVTDGSKYIFGSVESDAGTATLTTSSNTQTVSCSGNVTRVVLYAGSSYQVRATDITITYYNSNFNSNPTCCTPLGAINGSVN